MRLTIKVLILLIVMLSITANAQKKDVTISEKAAIIVFPSKEKIAQLKKESASEDEYSSIIENGIFYLDNAKIFLKNKGIKLIKIYSSDVLKFKNKTTTKNFDIKNLSWEIIFYMPNKSPKLVDITNVENEFQDYFLTVKTKKL